MGDRQYAKRMGRRLGVRRLDARRLDARRLDVGRPGVRRLGVALLAAAVIAGAYLAGATAASAAGPVMAAIKSIPDEGLYSESFTLDRPAEVEIEAVSAGSKDDGFLFSYPWLLDLDTRRVVWRMEIDDAEKARRDNLGVRTKFTLPAGNYGLYFTAHGGPYPLKKKIKFLKLFELGQVDVRGGVMVPWDRYGDPDDWFVSVRAAMDDFPLTAFRSPARPGDDAEILAFERVPSNSFLRAELELRQDARLRILAVGEYWAREQAFADGAWIETLDGCGRLWEMTLTNTEPAGGAKKNRIFDNEVTLKAGRYLVCYATDDTHAYGRWNMHPPFDPESWGIRLIPAEPLPADAFTVRVDPPEENRFVVIERVGDAEFRRVGFTVTGHVDVCVRGLGEWSFSDDHGLDYGWIENAVTLEELWSMRYERGVYAGGEARNRLVQESLRLAPGDYYLCYVSDYAHSFDGWAKEAPFDAAGWGIALRGIGQDFSPDSVRRFGPGDGPVTLIQLAALKDDAHRRVEFSVKEPTPVRIIALGEGTGGRMHDYGWLERTDTGEMVWKMTYQDTWHAGGAKKNRRAEQTLTLRPGAYALQFETDGSHSFGDWNAAEPDEGHLWGVSLLELVERP